MTESKLIKVYLASPFFNEEQLAREEKVKEELRRQGFHVFAPKEQCILEPNATSEQRTKVFEQNCDAIDKCDVMVAITDGKDMGTIWEAGYAAGLNSAREKLGKYVVPFFWPRIVEPRQVKIVYFCETLGDGKFNVMLAESGDIILTDFEQLKSLSSMLAEGKSQGFGGSIE